MKLALFESAADASESLARRVVAFVREKPNLILGLPTGRTPVRFYQELARQVRAGALDVSRLVTFNLDEFLGVDAADRGSYRQYMERHFFRPVGLAPTRVNFLNGAAANPGLECERYERAIAAVGGIDVQILGLGANGHIGFNEPAPWLAVRTHVDGLRPETRRANALLFAGDPERVPREALSMGVGTILRARRILMLATGREKARAVAATIQGRLTTEVPASLLQLHADVEVLLDRAAASGLEHA